MKKSELYQHATDSLAYMTIYAPYYPPSMPQTFDEAFVELSGYLDELTAREKRGISMIGIVKSRDAAMRAKRLFESGDETPGIVEIQYAHRYLELAAKGEPAVEPLFAGQGINPKL